MTRHLANAWGQYGIRVNCVAPGPIADTEGFRRLGTLAHMQLSLLMFGSRWVCVLSRAGGFMDDSFLKKFVDACIPAKRLGSRRDIGDAALFLCSDAASYVTGVSLVVDGGAWFRPGDAGAAQALMSHL